MKRLEIKPNAQYTDLTIIREVETTGRRKFLCECQCGNKTEVRLDHLTSGHSTSCGKCGIEWRGERRTLTAWAQSVEIDESTLRARLKIMSMDEAMRRGAT